MPLEEAVRFALGKEEIPARQAGPAARVSLLSERDRQVADLVARGRSNKEIAQELFISPRTAEGHVTKVMDKLGASSRAQVAAWVAGSRSNAQE